MFALLMLSDFALSSGKSLQLLHLDCLSAISMMFVKILLAVCMLVGIVV